MQIKVYSTPMCHFCHMIKDFLDKNNISYESIDVSIDETKAKEMVDKTGQMGVPVTIIAKDDGQEEIIVGFQESKLKEILNIK
ncbi:MAG: glutaredoxin domain-containing protein [Patescibacteria group bacterium]